MKSGRKSYEAPAVETLSVDDVAAIAPHMEVADRERFFAAWPALALKFKQRRAARP